MSKNASRRVLPRSSKKNGDGSEVPIAERLLVDNFLPHEQFTRLKEHLLGTGFPWFASLGHTFHQDSGLSTKCSEEDWRLAHTIYDMNKGVVSPAGPSMMEPFDDFMVALQPAVLCRLKVNFDHKQAVAYETEWHCDLPIGWPGDVTSYTGIFYMNTCNGYTQFESDGAPVKSEENRLLLFRTGLHHRGVTQTDAPRRVLMNVNFQLNALPYNAQRF